MRPSKKSQLIEKMIQVSHKRTGKWVTQLFSGETGCPWLGWVPCLGDKPGPRQWWGKGVTPGRGCHQRCSPGTEPSQPLNTLKHPQGSLTSIPIPWAAAQGILNPTPGLHLGGPFGFPCPARGSWTVPGNAEPGCDPFSPPGLTSHCSCRSAREGLLSPQRRGRSQPRKLVRDTRKHRE